MKTFRQRITLGLVMTAAATFVACGGGGSAVNNTSSSVINGLAATGMAIDNGQVNLKCVSGHLRCEPGHFALCGAG